MLLAPTQPANVHIHDTYAFSYVMQIPGWLILMVLAAAFVLVLIVLSVIWFATRRRKTPPPMPRP